MRAEERVADRASGWLFVARRLASLIYPRLLRRRLVVAARRVSACGSSKHHPHEHKSLTSSPRKYGTSLALKSTRPLSGRPNRVVDCIQVAALAAAVKIGNRPPLERVFIPFLDHLPTAKHPVRCHQNRVLREKRRRCGSVVLVVCLVQLLTKLSELSKCLDIPEEITLLDYSSICCILLLGEGRQPKADCQSYKDK